MYLDITLFKAWGYIIISVTCMLVIIVMSIISGLFSKRVRYILEGIMLISATVYIIATINAFGFPWNLSWYMTIIPYSIFFGFSTFPFVLIMHDRDIRKRKELRRLNEASKGYSHNQPL